MAVAGWLILIDMYLFYEKRKGVRLGETKRDVIRQANFMDLSLSFFGLEIVIT